MVETTTMMERPYYSWWFDSHNSPRRSPWLQSTLTELEKRTKAVLRLIEEDADSFAQRAEMYYKKRPELITMVEEFYRAHRSLAEKYDKLKSDPSSRLSTPLLSPMSSFKYRQEKLVSFEDDIYSEAHDSDVSEESEIDDPEREDEPQVDEQMDEVSSRDFAAETMRLKVEIERLREENRVQEQQLMQKDEEKREASRQLRLAANVSSGVFEAETMKLKEEIEKLKEENKVQRQQLMQKDEEKREASRQLSLAVEVSNGVFEAEMMKLKEEIERLKEENKVQKQLQKDEENRGASRELSLAVEVSSRVVEAEMMKLKEEIEGLKEENRVQQQQLMQKDEEKREAIRQLSLAVGVLKEENMNLKKRISITKESSKKWNPANEFNKFKGIFFGKLFNGFPKSQTGVELARYE
ncbi:Protein Networked (NET), actin-binding (NAB) domain [Dillenia turbinata]|uniref:Protein Networked (NET), actin-binding (NAB) domain n=1 Tax=Dillenia turbinata TaxID=194707 RepID=A0AAN8VVV0_9MAGN